MTVNLISQQLNNETEKLTNQQEVKEEFNYNIFTQNLNASGIKTTWLRNNETNFEQYANALSSNLKQTIVNSFDCEQDYALQAQIANIYAKSGKSVINQGEFMNTLKSQGLAVTVKYEATSYISDYKAGNFSGAVKDGRIAVYTITDNKGGEIIIADANGNGALESEEIFMNQILEGISSDIISGNFEQTTNDQEEITLSNISNNSYYDNLDWNWGFELEELNTLEELNSKDKVSQYEYNHLIDYYVYNNNYTVEKAIEFINTKYHLKNDEMKYTGNYKDLIGLATPLKENANNKELNQIEQERIKLEKQYNEG